MKRACIFLSVILVAALKSVAAPCGDGTLASYMALGATGCQIGNTTFADFQTLSGTSGASQIPPGSVTLMPSGSIYNPQLSVTVMAAAGAGELAESIFNYQISGPTFVASTITLSGFSETLDGATTDIQNLCAGGVFGSDGVSGCTGSASSLLTLDGVQNQDSGALGPASMVSVTDDLTLDGGLAGSATGGTFTDQFSATPEPLSLFLAGFGLAAIGTICRLRGNVPFASNRN